MSYQINELQRPKDTRSPVKSRQRARKGSVTFGCNADRPRLNRHIIQESLLIQMLPLVRRIALKIRRHLPAHIEVDDLTGTGILGLVDALYRFNPSKRVTLETYARHRIRGAILDSLRGADPISRDMRRKNKRIEQVYHELESRLNRAVQDEEMADALEMTLGQWHRELNALQSAGVDSGSRVISAGPTKKLQSTDPELLVDGNNSPFDLYYRREQRRILAQALSRMPDRERHVLTLHDQHGFTMKQIASRLHVDESRVSQIHSVALGRLKASVDSVLNPRQATVSESRVLSMAAGAGG